MDGSHLDGQPREARDVMAFGQEVGRALSNGTIIGRSEPFAKVFPSSRVVKRAVGLVAWGVLEDIALDAYLDHAGRLVAETSIRRIARNLGLNKDTVTRHLARLREYGFVLHEELRDDANGRYARCRYILDPSACIERFTATPHTRSRSPGPAPRRRNTTAPPATCPRSSPGDTRSEHKLRLALEDLGVSVPVAAELVSRFPADRIESALTAVARTSVRSPAGWVVTAIRKGWLLLDISDAAKFANAGDTAKVRRAELHHDDSTAEARTTSGDGASTSKAWAAWDRAVSASLTDSELLALVRLSSRPVPGVGWMIPSVRAELILLAATAWANAGADASLHDVLNGTDRPTLNPESGATAVISLRPPEVANDDQIDELAIRLTRLLSSRRQ